MPCGAIRSIAAMIGRTAQTLYNWVRYAEREKRLREVLTAGGHSARLPIQTMTSFIDDDCDA